MGLIDDIKFKKKKKEAENWFKMALNAKNNTKKIEYFTHSLELEPNNVSAWIKKGKALEAEGRLSEAQKSYEEAAQLDPLFQITLKHLPTEEEIVSLNSSNEKTEGFEESVLQDYVFNKPEEENITYVYNENKELEVPVENSEPNKLDEKTEGFEESVLQDYVFNKPEKENITNVYNENKELEVSVENSEPKKLDEKTEGFEESVLQDYVFNKPEKENITNVYNENKELEASVENSEPNKLDENIKKTSFELGEEEESLFTSLKNNCIDSEIQNNNDKMNEISSKVNIDESKQPIFNFKKDNVSSNNVINSDEEQSSEKNESEDNKTTLFPVQYVSHLPISETTQDQSITFDQVREKKLRIPLLDALKFWLIGAIVILILYLIVTKILPQ